MASQSTKKKKLSDEAYHIIRNDIPLREKLAKALNIENMSVYLLAVRKSTKLSLPFLLDILVKHTGKSKEEILEIETLKQIK